MKSYEKKELKIAVSKRTIGLICNLCKEIVVCFANAERVFVKKLVNKEKITNCKA